MRPIPPKMRQEIEKEPRMKHCALHGLERLYGACSAPGTKLEWHHPFLYAGKQINEKWAIVAACKYHHRRVNEDRAIKMAFEAYSLMLATEADLGKYPRRNWLQLKKSLGIKC